MKTCNETPARHVDLSFQPDTYWPVSLTQEQLLSRIRGKARRDLARRILQERGFKGLTTFLAREELPEADRKSWGAIHPAFMGGEYLPALKDGEVEIARISLRTTTGDQISVRARREGPRILYSVVGEYEDPDMQYQLAFEDSRKPLTLGELVKLIDGTNMVADTNSGGLVVANWDSMIGRGAAMALAFVSIESPFYPELATHYRDAFTKWAARYDAGDDGDEA